MPSEGSDVLLFESDLGLSDTNPSKNDTAVLYRQELGRGRSAPSKDQPIILVQEELGQTEGGVVSLGELDADRILYKGEDTELLIPAKNTGTNPVDYEVVFEETPEGGSTTSVVGSVTKTLSPGQEAPYRQRVQKDNTGCFDYQANDSNVIQICWMNIRATDLIASRYSLYVDGDVTSTNLSTTVTVPSAESNDIDVTVEFEEDGSQIASETQTISPGNTYQFETTVDKTVTGEFTYQAFITDSESGLTAPTNTVDVLWTDDPAAAIELADFSVTDRVPQVGDSVTFTATASNVTDQDVQYDVNFFEGPTIFKLEQYSLGSLETHEYSADRTKTDVFQAQYLAEDTEGINTTDQIQVTWFPFDVGELQVDPQILLPGETTTVSLDVTNTNTSRQYEVQVEFLEDGSVVFDETRTLPTGPSTETFSVDRTETVETTNGYTARITHDGTTGNTDTKDVVWGQNGIYIDPGDGLREANPKSVSSFSDWYGYRTDNNEPRANHSYMIQDQTSVVLLDDGTNIGVAITHHNGEGTGRNQLREVFTYFTFLSGSHGGYSVLDDPEYDEPSNKVGETAYTSDRMWQFFGDTNTDGCVFILDPGDDVVISVSGETARMVTFPGGDANLSCRILNHN